MRISVRALQTRLYFWLLERRFGVPETEIAKDGFLQLLTRLSDGKDAAKEFFTPMGFGADRRRELRPGLIDVSLNAYGWSGPWRNRRGFDSLVQMSSGIADEGMRRLARPSPTPLPVQALDHATGYLMAAAAIRGLTGRLTTSCGHQARLSLARTAALLINGSRDETGATAVSADESDWRAGTEQTDWGPARRLRGPVTIGEVGMQWERPAARLGSSPAEWWAANARSDGGSNQRNGVGTE